MRRKITSIILALAFAMSTNAQSGDWNFSARLGYNLGGTAPLPLPSEMESINSFNPGANFGIEADAEKMLSDKWGIMAGLRFEMKGMKADVTVANYHTILTQDNERIEGNFTGQQSSEASFALITIPAVARFHIGDKWTLAAGPYVSYALSRRFKGEAYNGYMRYLSEDPITGEMVPIGNRVDIVPEKKATYNFSDNLRRLQWGVEVGADWQCTDKVMVFAHLDWGLNDAFKDAFNETISFPMYPIYGMIGIGYSF